MTFRQQLGFGVHVLVMMGTFYALGHYAASHVSRNIAHVGALAGATQSGLCGHKPCGQSLSHMSPPVTACMWALWLAQCIDAWVKWGFCVGPWTAMSV